MSVGAVVGIVCAILSGSWLGYALIVMRRDVLELRREGERLMREIRHRDGAP